MAAGLHGSARTTPRVRAELQASQEATRILAAEQSVHHDPRHPSAIVLPVRAFADQPADMG